MATKASGSKQQSITEIWDELVLGLNMIYKKQSRVPPHRYMELYTLVFNFCTKQQEENGPISKTNKRAAATTALNANSGAEFIGAELYERLKNFITKFAETLLQTCLDLNGEELLTQYTTVWKDFQFSSTVVNGIFAYLNRHWIKREIDEGKPNVFEIYNLSVMLWKEVIFDVIHSNITSSILTLITQERGGEMITTKLVSGVVSSYIELGINEPDLGLNQQQAGQVTRRAQPKLAVYQQHLERRFLDETRTFYTQESNDFVQHNSVTEYLKKVETRLCEERDRCELYLHHSTQEPLASTCDDVLIRQHLELFQSEFETLLCHQQDEDLARMFSLCERVSGALDQLRLTLESHIEREGRDAILKIAESAVNDPKQYVTTILAVHKRFNSLVTGSFRQDIGFVQAMDKAFTAFINSNQVTQGGRNSSKSPELLARYCDQLLRKSAKNPEEDEMEELLSQVMVVFKYIEDKDVFQKFYSKMLAKRLVNELSASDEAESNMIAKLKQMCGFEYTSKLQRMFTDANTSKDISDQYKTHLQAHDQEAGVDFSIMVLASSVWPFNQTAPFEIPRVLSDQIDQFTTFYIGRHNGRKLAWLLFMCRGELISTPFNRKYTFISSTAQIAVLMHYNNATEYTIDTLVELLKMPVAQLLPVIQSLAKAELLKVAGGEQLEIDSKAPGTTVLQLNSQFSNKKLKVDLSKAMARNEVKKESEEVQKTVEDDRRLVIQAAIVRIMKMRKTSKHNALMQEVIGQLASRFQPKIPVIKKCIDILIEKDYIKRLENDRDSYEYLA